VIALAASAGFQLRGRRFRAATSVLRDQIGEMSLVGFFCNGEILHNRVYGYTGVLLLFL
jgi:small ligand-binding sensory domain FIST